MVHTCKVISPGICFFFIIFSKFWFSRLWSVLKGKKQPKIMNEYYISCAVSQDQCSIWSWFLVQLYKMMISPSLFFIFPKLWFFGLLGGKKAKNGPKWQKKSVHRIPYLIHHMMVICHTQVQNDISRYFFIFSKFRLFWVFRGVKG